MDYVFVVHVVHDANQLVDEKAAGIFAHASKVLTQVEHEAAVDILHGDIDNALDDFARGFDYESIGAVID